MAENVQVIKPLLRAWGMTARTFFRPFRPEAWIILGLLVWVLSIGQFGWLSPGRQFEPVLGLTRIATDLTPGEYFDWFVDIFIRALVYALVIPFVIGLVWLRSRMMFCLYDSISHRNPRLTEPFKQYRLEADSYFKWSLLLMLTWGLCLLAIGAVAVLFSLREMTTNGFGNYSLKAVFVSGFLLGIVSLVMGFASLVFESFIAPVMYLHRRPFPNAAALAWQELVQPNLFAVLGFFFVRVIGFCVVSMLLATVMLIPWCCCGFTPLLAGIIGLPFFYMLHCYSLTFIDQLGPEGAVFKGEEETHRCIQCDYDLRGTPAARKCPECGSPVSPRFDLLKKPAANPATGNGQAAPAPIDPLESAPGAAASAPNDPAQSESMDDVRQAINRRAYEAPPAPIDMDDGPAGDPPSDPGDAKPPQAPPAAAPVRQSADGSGPQGLEVDMDTPRQPNESSATDGGTDVPRIRVIDEPPTLKEPEAPDAGPKHGPDKPEGLL